MRLISLIDNIVYEAKLQAEHGFSLYIEQDNIHLLFDTGQTDSFINNSELLGINLQEVDYVVISHGHYDHIGGLEGFLKLNSKAKIIAHKNTFNKRCKGDKNVGIPNDFYINKKRLLYCDSVINISKNIRICSAFVDKNPLPSTKKEFTIRNEDGCAQDFFSDELYIVLHSLNENILVSACSHNGIERIIEKDQTAFKTPIHHVIGGFHIQNMDNIYLGQLTDFFNKSAITRIGVSHCTGIRGYQFLKENFKGNVYYSATGNSITF